MPELSVRERDELTRRLAGRRLALRAEVEHELRNSDDPRLLGFKNELAATADWVLVTEDAVWIAGTKPYSVQRIDPATNKEKDAPGTLSGYWQTALLQKL